MFIKFFISIICHIWSWIFNNNIDFVRKEEKQCGKSRFYEHESYKYVQWYRKENCYHQWKIIVYKHEMFQRSDCMNFRKSMIYLLISIFILVIIYNYVIPFLAWQSYNANSMGMQRFCNGRSKVWMASELWHIISGLCASSICYAVHYIDFGFHNIWSHKRCKKRSKISGLVYNRQKRIPAFYIDNVAFTHHNWCNNMDMYWVWFVICYICIAGPWISFICISCKHNLAHI